MNLDQVLQEILIQYRDFNIDENTAISQIKKVCAPPERNKSDFIDCIYDLFKKRYLEKRGIEYEDTNIGKERKAIGYLLKKYKSKEINKLKTTEDCIRDIDELFIYALSINEKYFIEGMSISFIYSNLNRIKIKIKNVKFKNELTELSEIINKNFTV